MKRIISALLLFLYMLAFTPGIASAHILPGSYLRLTAEGKTLQGTWDLSLYSLAETAGLKDEPEEKLQDFAVDQLSIKAGGETCKLRADKENTKINPDDYDIPQPIQIIGECPQTITSLTIDYFSLFIIDDQYQGFVKVTAHDQTYSSVLSKQNPSATFQIGTKEEEKAPDRWLQFKDYFREGVWHIWLGYDHIMFLLSLLLPAAFILKKGRWQPRMEKFGGTFWQVTKIVTAFTVAHSITLGLVIFNVISLPSRIVESTIALSIVIAAANNLHPLLGRRLWLLTFCFGFIHGMGFAGALKELGLPDDAKWVALAGFNLGVEGGQLAIVTAILPIIYAFRHNDFYRNVLLRALSTLIIAAASVWFIQRAFAITLLGGILGG